MITIALDVLILKIMTKIDFFFLIKNRMLFEIASVIYGIVWTANAAVLSFADVYEPEQRKASLMLIIQCIVMPHSLLAFYVISRLEDYITYCATAALTFVAHIVYAVFITIAFYDIITAADVAVCLPASILVWFYGIVAQLYLAFAGTALTCGLYMQIFRCFHEHLYSNNHYTGDSSPRAKDLRKEIYNACRCPTICDNDAYYNCCNKWLNLHCNCVRFVVQQDRRHPFVLHHQ
jgi:hypothetical protein